MNPFATTAAFHQSLLVTCLFTCADSILSFIHSFIHSFIVFTAVCLSVYPHYISKTDAARIARIVVQMFHDESGVRSSKVKVTPQKNSAGVDV